MCAAWRVDALSRFGDRGYLETNRAARSNCCVRLQQLISEDQLYVPACSGHVVSFFLKTASALGCGILHLHPRDVSFERMELDSRYKYLDIVSVLVLVDDTKFSSQSLDSGFSHDEESRTAVLKI